MNDVYVKIKGIFWYHGIVVARCGQMQQGCFLVSGLLKIRKFYWSLIMRNTRIMEEVPVSLMAADGSFSFTKNGKKVVLKTRDLRISEAVTSCEKLRQFLYLRFRLQQVGILNTNVLTIMRMYSLQ